MAETPMFLRKEGAPTDCFRRMREQYCESQDLVFPAAGDNYDFVNNDSTYSLLFLSSYRSHIVVVAIQTSSSNYYMFLALPFITIIYETVYVDCSADVITCT